MKTISKLMAAAVMTAVSVSAQAWWGGPNSWNDGFFGDGGFNLQMSASAHGNGRNRYHNGYTPYYGYAPYAATAPALSAEQQAQAFEQAREAQRQFAEEQHAAMRQFMEERGLRRDI